MVTKKITTQPINMVNMVNTTYVVTKIPIYPIKTTTIKIGQRIGKPNF